MAKARLRIFEVKAKPKKVGMESRHDKFFLRFDALNGEPLGTGETHPSKEAADASREAWLRGMVDVLEAEGVQLLFPSKHPFPWMKGRPKKTQSDYYTRGYEDGFEGRPQGAENVNVSDLADKVSDYYQGYDLGKADREEMQRRGSSNT